MSGPARVPMLVDGQPRRICDVIAAAPWAVRFSFAGDGLASRHPRAVALRRAVTALNARGCEALVQGRVHVVFADEVADELRWSEETSQRAITQTPGAMPPFNAMMVEARLGRAMADGFDFVGNAAVGNTAHRGEAEFLPAIDEIVGSAARGDEERVGRVAARFREAARAVVVIGVWVQQRSGAVWGPVARLAYAIGEDYRVLLSRGEEDGAPEGGPLYSMRIYSGVDGYGGDDQELVGHALHLAFATFVRVCGMMNCSNVRTVVGGETNSGVGASRRSRDRLAVVRYHVLRLQVGTELREVAPPAAAGERACPLTMVRGHFKDFSRGGLFGRLRGERYAQVWCPAFVRGRAEDGAVVRDYAMEGKAASS